GSIGVWSEDGILQSLWRDNDSPRQLAFSPDGSRIIGTDSFSLVKWDWQARKQVSRVRLKERAFGFAYSPSLNLVAARSLHQVQVYSADSWAVARAIPTLPGLPLVTFHPSEAVLAVSDRNGVS